MFPHWRTTGKPHGLRRSPSSHTWCLVIALKSSFGCFMLATPSLSIDTDGEEEEYSFFDSGLDCRLMKWFGAGAHRWYHSSVLNCFLVLSSTLCQRKLLTQTLIFLSLISSELSVHAIYLLWSLVWWPFRTPNPKISEHLRCSLLSISHVPSFTYWFPDAEKKKTWPQLLSEIQHSQTYHQHLYQSILGKRIAAAFKVWTDFRSAVCLSKKENLEVASVLQTLPGHNTLLQCVYSLFLDLHQLDIHTEHCLFQSFCCLTS